MKAPVIKMSDAVKHASLKVVVRIRRDWRYRLGIWLIRAGAAVLRCGFKLEEGSP